MPAYEYLCEACGSRFERRQKMSDPEVDSCPTCSGAVKRLISGGAGVVSKAGSYAAGAGCESGGPCCGQEASCPMGGSCH